MPKLQVQKIKIYELEEIAAIAHTDTKFSES